MHGRALYQKKTIPKKSGGVRILHVPDRRVAFVQRRFLHNLLNPFPYPEYVSAYVPGRNTVHAAQQHAGRAVLIVLDIKNFFLSTRRAWVKDALISQLGFGEEAAQAGSSLLTVPLQSRSEREYGRVPQGAPTSGAIANLVALDRLDPRILHVAATYGVRYTRYADDLALSFETDPGKEAVSALITRVMGCIRAAGYRVNYSKIRVVRRNKQQRLLGLTVNEFPNFPRKNYRNLRALAHNCTRYGYAATAEKYGYRDGDHLEGYLRGMVAYLGAVSPRRAEELTAKLPL